MPTAHVAKPSSLSISAMVPAERAILPRMLGNPVSKLETARMPTAWWLRPVRRQARVGEHSAVVWKLV